MEWQADRRLQIRMGLTMLAMSSLSVPLLLLSFVVLFLTATMTLGVVVMVLVGNSGSSLVLVFWANVVFSAAVAVVLSAAVVPRELRWPSRLLRSLDLSEKPVPGGRQFLSELERLASQLGVLTPTVYLVDSDAPEVFTVGFGRRRSKLVVTRGFFQTLNEAERRAVAAHELAHVKNGDATVMTLASLPTVLGEEMLDKAGGHRWLLPLWPFALALQYAGLTVLASLSRSREFVADRGAVALTGDSAALASALQTLDEASSSRPKADFRTANVAALSAVPGALGPSSVASTSKAAAETQAPDYLDPEWDGHALHRYEEDDGDPPTWFVDLREKIRTKSADTHPPTAERVRRLRELSRDLESR
ncbi:hypothetical protein AUR64_19150 [Haloprofundus marisrubri]|uniref:Peptidase M48 domain-containing protein n=1 Tax=Haloprofundus marisrubri TaxID=1514971 RepID=A0A0W1R5I3_9EURY|nr:M48 family metalloprotease [Haloprofundus marisrubri]KTG08351.1 hypothetical protein AUR64_19150 [Haloprofundus marisrubri]